MLRSLSLALLLTIGLLTAIPAAADSLLISTGSPDGLIAMAARPGSGSKIEIEAADDFILTGATNVTSGSFVGLLPSGASLSSISEVVVEIYRVFPKDSTYPPSGNVLTRVNSPSDVAFESRDSATGSLKFTTSVSGIFTANNSVLNDINKKPNQFTGGEGSVTGEEVSFNVTFTTPFDLPADHYFFVPQVLLTDGDFFWLSAPKPIVPPGTPFPPGFTDLQTWMRNGDLDPDWSRVGTDITHQGPFNGTFTLSGSPSVPEPSTLLLLGTGLLALVGFTTKKTEVTT